MLRPIFPFQPSQILDLQFKNTIHSFPLPISRYSPKRLIVLISQSTVIQLNHNRLLALQLQ